MKTTSKQFFELINFGKEIVALCNKLNIMPVVHGSLAVYYYYTKDKNMEIHDIDFLVPDRCYDKVIKIVKSKKISHKNIKEWHVLQIFKNRLKIEIDSIEYNPKEKRNNKKISKDLKVSLDSIEYHYKDPKKNKPFPKDFKYFNLNGLKCNVLSLESLKKFYKMAHGRSSEDKVKLKEKIDMLAKIK